MISKRLLVVGLVVTVLAALVAGAAGCSLNDAKAKAALAAALAEFDLKALPLSATVQATDASATTTSGGTPVATAIKEGLAGIADEWQSVIEKAKKVTGADVAAAEKAWSDLQAAAESVPVGATAGEAGAIVGGPLDVLMTVREDLAGAAISTK
jgi:1,6-anhydro-N-acetylmuramate kinase